MLGTSAFSARTEFSVTTAGVWWAVAALRPIRATCADTAGCGAVQHPGVSPDDVTGHHRARTRRERVVDSCFPAVPRKLQGHLHRKGCDVGINCVAVYERHGASPLSA
jgi:hypothetical protein